MLNIQPPSPPPPATLSDEQIIFTRSKSLDLIVTMVILREMYTINIQKIWKFSGRNLRCGAGGATVGFIKHITDRFIHTKASYSHLKVGSKNHYKPNPQKNFLEKGNQFWYYFSLWAFEYFTILLYTTYLQWPMCIIKKPNLFSKNTCKNA